MLLPIGHEDTTAVPDITWGQVKGSRAAKGAAATAGSSAPQGGWR